MRAYDRLEGVFERLSHLAGAQAVLQWDTAVIMPSGGAEARAGQLATLAVLRHELLTAPEVGECLQAAQEDTLDDWQRANLRQMRRAWRHASALPSDLVDALSRARNACELRWREARANDDFAMLADSLQTVVELSRQAAVVKGEALDCAPYDALLDQYEGGLTTAAVDRCFATLEAELPGMIDAALTCQARNAVIPMSNGVGPALQEQRDQRRLGVVSLERVVDGVLADALRGGACLQRLEPHGLELAAQLRVVLLFARRLLVREPQDQVDEGELRVGRVERLLHELLVHPLRLGALGERTEPERLQLPRRRVGVGAGGIKQLRVAALAQAEAAPGAGVLHGGADGDLVPTV